MGALPLPGARVAAPAGDPCGTAIFQVGDREWGATSAGLSSGADGMPRNSRTIEADRQSLHMTAKRS